MSKSGNEPNARVKADERIEWYHRDGATVGTYSPEDTGFGRFQEITGQYHQVLDTVNWEEKEKYLNKYAAKTAAEVEIGSLSYCFGKCSKDVTDADLDRDEKNCMRECYFRRLNAKDDMTFMFQQSHLVDKMNLAKLDLI